MLELERRSKRRDLIDSLVTRILQRVTLSATIQCRLDLAREMRKWTFRIWTVAFVLGTACGAIGALIGGMAR